MCNAFYDIQYVNFVDLLCVFFQITFVIRLHVRTREHVLKNVDHSDVFVVSVTMEITVNVCCLFSACISLIHKKIIITWEKE